MVNRIHCSAFQAQRVGIQNINKHLLVVPATSEMAVPWHMRAPKETNPIVFFGANPARCLSIHVVTCAIQGVIIMFMESPHCTEPGVTACKGLGAMHCLQQ